MITVIYAHKAGQGVTTIVATLATLTAQRPPPVINVRREVHGSSRVGTLATLLGRGLSPSTDAEFHVSRTRTCSRRPWVPQRARRPSMTRAQLKPVQGVRSPSMGQISTKHHLQTTIFIPALRAPLIHTYIVRIIARIFEIST